MKTNKEYTIFDILQYIEEKDNSRKSKDEVIENQLMTGFLLENHGVFFSSYLVTVATKNYDEETERIAKLREKALNMLSAPKEEQQVFINEMTPILDIFYDKKEKNKQYKKEVHN